ncbi:MAG: chorismate mutase [Chloroflexi bacterium GWB2_49_20]|nr:MAG: chorismate mutase [Chloroflexi bacterium GWB2_49_20]OGN76075.1 MAG: chorismate mutase [Chloroflexi bacterium GWC2_49_37]OGN83461.1 MAG: chorismate mutase [Chloroflexi bacterium GWD2_49_16]HBG73859.1 chorismate mutase [Anaerolineae bacterium]HCC79562.1 chorismate mutase [Anaerolineae bacterium]
MTTRGIRGAITLKEDEKAELLLATQELLTAIFAANPDLQTEDIASALFTVTDDITSAFPAQAARQIGWDLVPMICTREIPVPDSLPFCIRVLIHWNTTIQQSKIHHVFLRDSVTLRPDLTART